MGLGTKIKNALHGTDDRRSPRESSDYEDGRVPGSFPSDADTAAASKSSRHTDGRDHIAGTQDTSLTGKHGTTTTAPNKNTVDAGSGLDTSHSTLRKSHRHQKSDSGVDIGVADGTGLDKDGHDTHHIGNNNRLSGVDHHKQQRQEQRGAGDSPIEQPQPVKPITSISGSGSGAAKVGQSPPYWGHIDGNRGGNVNNATTGANAANAYQKDLPMHPGGQSATRGVGGGDAVGNTHGSSMLNPGNTLNNLDTDDSDPYWTNEASTAPGTIGNGYGYGNNTYGNSNNNNNTSDGYNDGVFKTSNTSTSRNDYQTGPGTTGLHSGQHSGSRDVNTRDINTRDLHKHHDVAGSGLADRHNTHADRGIGLGGAGMVHPDDGPEGGHDSRMRDRDMGRDRGSGFGGAGSGAGAGLAAGAVGGVAASEAARRHHEADLEEYQNSGGNSNNSNNNNMNSYSNRLSGNSVGGRGNGGRVAYARSAGGSPPRMQGGGGQHHQQQQQHMDSSSATNSWPQQQGQRQNQQSQLPQQSQQSQQQPMHYGPGHTAARVLHTCSNCGVDNDISQYFRPDVAYRLGQ